MSEIIWPDDRIVATTEAAGLIVSNFYEVWEYVTPRSSDIINKTVRYRSILAYWAMIRTRRGPVNV